jgi:hypothetical protein
MACHESQVILRFHDGDREADQRIGDSRAEPDDDRAGYRRRARRTRQCQVDKEKPTLTPREARLVQHAAVRLGCDPTSEKHLQSQ